MGHALTRINLAAGSAAESMLQPTLREDTAWKHKVVQGPYGIPNGICCSKTPYAQTGTCAFTVEIVMTYKIPPGLFAVGNKLVAVLGALFSFYKISCWILRFLHTMYFYCTFPYKIEQNVNTPKIIHNLQLTCLLCFPQICIVDIILEICICPKIYQHFSLKTAISKLTPTAEMFNNILY